MAKEKSPAIIFIDELDAIGTKRFDSEKAGDREVQRTMLELLNQLDGFSSTAEIKVGNLELLMPCPSLVTNILGWSKFMPKIKLIYLFFKYQM